MIKSEKKLFKLKKQIQSTIETIAAIKIQAIKAGNESISRQCNLLYGSQKALLDYVINMIEDDCK